MKKVFFALFCTVASSVTLSITLSLQAEQLRLKPAPFNPALKVKAVSHSHVLMEDTTGSNKHLIIAHDTPSKAIGLAFSNSDFISAEFSNDSSFLLVALNSLGSQVLHLYQTSTGLRLATNKSGVDKIQDIFWIDDCRYGAILAPLENGGSMKIVLRQDAPECKQFIEKNTAMRLVGLWRDAHFNVYGRYSESSLELMNWIGEGSFTDFQIAHTNTFLFRNVDESGILYLADASKKKIQPLGVYEMLLSMPQARSYLASDGSQLLSLQIDKQYNVSEAPIVAGQFDEMHWIVPGKSVLLFSEENGYQLLELTREKR